MREVYEAVPVLTRRVSQTAGGRWSRPVETRYNLSAMEQRSQDFPTSLSSAKRTAFHWVDANRTHWSRWNSHIWDLAETAWREYRSCEWYVTKLKAEGFSVERGRAACRPPSPRLGTGPGPTIMAYAEYDAVPGNCQKAATYRAPRLGLSRFAGGHTDPHSALGIGALAGLLAAKAAMEKHGLKGTLRFMGEPAEKMRGSKPIHAAKGYYDGLDAIVSFHPFYMLPLCNTARWDTHCGPYYCVHLRVSLRGPRTLAHIGRLRKRRRRFRLPIPRPALPAPMMLSPPCTRSPRCCAITCCPTPAPGRVNEIILNCGPGHRR